MGNEYEEASVMGNQVRKVLVVSAVILAASVYFACNAAAPSGRIIDIYFNEYNNAILELEGSGTAWIGCTSVLFGNDGSIIGEIDWEPKQVVFGNNGKATTKFSSIEFWAPTFSRWTTWWLDDRVGFVFALWKDKLTPTQYKWKYKTLTLPESFSNTNKPYIMDELLSQKWVVDQDGYLLYKTY